MSHPPRVLIVRSRRCGRSWMFEQLKAIEEAGLIELVEPGFSRAQLDVETYRGELGRIEQFNFIIDEAHMLWSAREVVAEPDPKIKTYGPPVKGKKGKLKRW